MTDPLTRGVEGGGRGGFPDGQLYRRRRHQVKDGITPHHTPVFLISHHRTTHCEDSNARLFCLEFAYYRTKIQSSMRLSPNCSNAMAWQRDCFAVTRPTKTSPSELPGKFSTSTHDHAKAFLQRRPAYPKMLLSVLPTACARIFRFWTGFFFFFFFFLANAPSINQSKKSAKRQFFYHSTCKNNVRTRIFNDPDALQN